MSATTLTTTTATTLAPTPAIDLSTTHHVSMARLTRVELRKLVDTRAGLWLFVAMGLITAAAVVIFLFAADASALTFENIVTTTLTPQGFLLPVLGILAVTSEWGQRTGLVTFTLEPSRSRVVMAKVNALLLAGVVAVALALALAALGNAAGAAFLDGNGSWAFGTDGLRDVLILQLSGLIQGLAFGMLLMNGAAAIVLYFVVPIAWSVLFTMVSALNDPAPWIDLGTAQTPLFEHAMTGDAWLHLLATSLIWIVVPLALGVARLLRKELK